MANDDQEPVQAEEGNPWVHGAPTVEHIEVVPYNEEWPGRYTALEARIAEALGDGALKIAHVGSTAVPGLAAKDVIDIDLTVRNPRREETYVPQLTALGYDLTVREPWWHEHRMLRLAQPRVNLHVFGHGTPELSRHLMFRDWLRSHPDDRELYAKAKAAAAPGACHAMEYNSRKQTVVEQIYERMYAGRHRRDP
ncbi:MULTISPECIES: GrpB family protein [Streptomyces]|uniref:GrpB family protein n=1 Tax=Streptomyces TaxID=1883 RepID=UPI001A93CA8E|nr:MULTISPECIES: GrpB family protein [Streptomyces]MBO0914043.1 GrpB family protein [Streptomyces laculatispora]MCX4768127.1 GrpB family protein [Streptomyces sp. NBC_01285]